MVSIIIPNYNKSKFIKETILSVLNQTSNQWECIIIDDNSNDNSLEVMDFLIAKNSKFSVIKNSKCRGASFCRNLGASKAKGEYLIFLDADDLIDEKCIEIRFKIMNSKRELAFSVFKMGTFYKNIGDSSSVWNDFSGHHLDRFLSHDLPWAICSVIWRKKEFIRIGSFNTDFTRLQDVELHTKALINKMRYKIVKDSKVDCYYRINLDRITETYFQLLNHKLESTIFYVEFFAKNLIENNLENKLKFLKGTLFKSLSEIFSSYHLMLISNQEKEDLLKMYLGSMFKIDLLNKADIFILKLYIKIQNKVRIKGINFILNKYLIS